MQVSDPKVIEHLRDLPIAYLLDLLTDGAEIEELLLYRVLQERGMTPEEIDHGVKARRNSRLPKPQTLWAIARWFTLLSALIVTFFNLTAMYLLFYSEHIFKAPIIFCAIGCVIFGFLIGYKLTCHIYLGGKTALHCGFPVAMGFVDLETGSEQIFEKLAMLARMSVNAMVGVNLSLFPLMFLFVMMS
ncbi:MAG: hypothetical protein OET90_00035 [Desulfuromonadales bacterium]|nr:hypothetical protein [Desulfuromonadales bacterium]